MTNNINNHDFLIDPEINYHNQEITDNLCEYYTTDQILSNNKLSFNFNLINYNVRSFHSNGDQFQCLINSIKPSNPIIVLTETWNNTDNVVLCNIDGFQCFHTYRVDGRGGGVSIFCLDSVKTDKIHVLCKCTQIIETCVVKMCLNGETAYIIAVYRPPNSDVNEFLVEVECLLQSFNFHNDLVIITGDFNIDLTNLNLNSARNLSSLFSSMFFYPLITKPTRLGIKSTTLDHIWMNKYFPSFSGIIYFDVTDHCPSFLNFSLPNSLNIEENIVIESRPFSDFNFTSLKNKLANTNWNAFLDFEDINNCYRSFVEYLNSQYCNFFPKKTKNISSKRRNNPWITTDIKRKINQKSHFYKLYRKGLISRELNNMIKNKISKEIKNAKDLYFKSKLIFHKNDLKKSWEIIKKLSGKTNKKDEIVELIDNDIILTDKTDIANSFVNFFSNIAQNLDDILPNSTISPYTYITSNANTFFISPVTTDECKTIVAKLKTVKSDINVMPVYLFKLIFPCISKIFCKIINESFTVGIFPEDLKLARITPIFKKGDKLKATNFRPISSLPYIGKIFERCMINRLLGFFDKFSILSHVQFGFRRKKSTQDAIIDLINNIHDSLNNKKYHISIFIDLKKAFDTVNHEILLKKLELYGIRGVGLNWIKSYLMDRQYYVGIGKFKSKICKQNLGVVQGSIIGPLLFLIYINDLPKISQNTYTTLYADDTAVTMKNDNFSNLIRNVNSELFEIRQWTLSNRLTINETKTEAILFTNRPIPQNHDNICLGNTDLNFTSSCRYLGIQLDKSLSFSNHISSIIGKLSKISGILFKIRDSLTLNARINFYYAFCYPYLSQNVVVWGKTSNIYLDPLIKQQKRIIRIMSDAAYLEHTTPLFYKLGLLKFCDIYQFNILVYSFRSLKSNKFSVQHTFNTRNRQRASSKFQRLAITQRSINFTGPKLWNDLPEYLKSIDSLYVFKKALKSYFLDNYNDTSN